MEETCGIIELLSGAVCGLEEGHRTFHSDRSQDGIEIQWCDEDHLIPIYTAHSNPTSGYWQPVR